MMDTLQNQTHLRVMGWPAFQYKNLNPCNSLLYSAVQKHEIQVLEFSVREILFGNYDIVHVHWPELYLSRKSTFDAILKTLIVFSLLGIAKLRKARILWTVHNLAPHNEYHPFLTKIFWSLFPYLLDGYISLNQTTYRLAESRYPSLLTKKKLVFQFGHGDYRDAYPNAISKANARKKLDIPQNAFVYLFIGSISPYKNVLQLIRCFQDVQGEENILLIAGKPDNPITSAQLRSFQQEDARIWLYLQFIPDEELQVFLNSADLVVLPFQDISNSGTAVLSLSFNRPVLVPHKGCLIDLQNVVGADWVQTYKNNLTSTRLLQAKNSMDMLGNQKIDPEKLSWEKIASETAKFCKELIR